MSSRHRRAVLAVTAAGAGLTLAATAFAGPAAAAGTTPFQGAFAAAASDFQGAGYSADAPAGPRHVLVTKFRVPRVICPPSSSAPGAGIGVLLDGVDGAFAGAIAGAQCSGSTPVYFVAIGGSASSPVSQVAVGDLLKVTVTTSTKVTSMRVENVTSGTVTADSGGPIILTGYRLAVTGGEVAPRGNPHVLTATLGSVTVDGAPLATLNPVKHDATGPDGQTVLTTSDLTASSGFTVTYVRPTA